MATSDTAFDRLFVDDADERPDEIVVENLTAMDADAFVGQLEAVADAAGAITTIATDLERLRQTGLEDDDVRDLIYGRNAGLAKRDIDALLDAMDKLTSGRADRPQVRLLAALSDLSLSETEDLLDELDRLNQRYGGADDRD